jgi:hypothetical protein
VRPPEGSNFWHFIFAWNVITLFAVSEVTQILERVQQGEARAADEQLYLQLAFSLSLLGGTWLRTDSRLRNGIFPSA